jgi:hypothetical protein
VVQVETAEVAQTLSLQLVVLEAEVHLVLQQVLCQAALELNIKVLVVVQD